MKTLSRFVLLLVCVLSFYHCAADLDSEIENAKFDLDNGDFDSAIIHASNALDADPGNVQAASLLAAAYFGRSNIDFLDIAEVVVDLGESDDEESFQLVADALPADGSLTDLRLAIETLESLTGVDTSTISNEELADAVFDLGLMQIIEQYAIGVYQSGFKSDALDVTDITSEGAADALEDLREFDGRMVATGTATDESFITDVRQTFCILEPISAGEGFLLAEYQALVGCQLVDDPDTFDTTALTADIANCDAINPDSQTAAVQSCYDENTPL